MKRIILTSLSLFSMGCHAAAADGALLFMLQAQQHEIWHDLKPAAFYGIEDTDLIVLMRQYESLEKSDKRLCEQRKDILLLIARRLQELEVGDVYDVGRCLLLQTAANKAWYLQELGHVPERALQRLFGIEGREKLRTVSGAYEEEWAPYLDPALRGTTVLKELFTRWRAAVECDRATPDFYWWLEAKVESLHLKRSDYVRETGVSPLSFVSLRRVLFDAQGRAYSCMYGNKLKPEFADQSLLYHCYQMSMGTCKGVRKDYHFVIDKQGDLYLTTGHSHAETVRGGNVIAAGDIQFDSEGYIVFLSNESGHYKPSPADLKRGLTMMKVRYQNEHLFEHLHVIRLNGYAELFTSVDAIPMIGKSFSLGRQSLEGFKARYEKLLTEGQKAGILIHALNEHAKPMRTMVLKEIFYYLSLVASHLGATTPCFYRMSPVYKIPRRWEPYRPDISMRDQVFYYELPDGADLPKLLVSQIKRAAQNSEQHARIKAVVAKWKRYKRPVCAAAALS